MSFERPSLIELVTRTQQDFISRMSLVGALLRRSVVYVLSRVWAGAAHLMHGHLDWLAKQLFPDTSDYANLVRQGTLLGVNPLDASFSEGTVTATGTDGSVIAEDETLVSADGAVYTVTADATIASGTATVSIVAVEAGSDGDLDADTVLTFEAPTAGVDATATVIELSGGSEEEEDDYRTRVIERMQSRPSAGTEADYVGWAKEVTGVTRVWPESEGLGPGTVVVRAVRDNDVSIIPDAGEVAAIQDYIDSVRPITAAVTVVAPVAAPVAITVSITPDTAATQTAVEAELADMLYREAEPGGTVLLSQLQVAIGNADGVTDFEITSPVADVTHTANQLPTLGAMTYV